MIVDSQVHLWEPESAANPWVPGGSIYAHRDSFTSADLLEEMEIAGVSQAVLVPPSWVGSNNSACLRAARSRPGRFAVMARLPATRDDGAPLFDELWDDPAVFGFRFTLNRDPAPLTGAEAAAGWMWSYAEAKGAPVAVYAPGNWTLLAQLAERYPDLRLAIDHGAVPLDVNGLDLSDHIRRLLGMAKYENVVVKLTGLSALLGAGIDVATVQAMICRIIDGFGADRAFWGSDLTRLPVTYESSVRLFQGLAGQISERSLSLVLGDGIMNWLGWQPRRARRSADQSGPAAIA